MKIEAAELRVWIKAEARDKINLWVGMAQGEVSGLGLIEEVEDGFLVTEVFLPEQICGGQTTDIEPEAVAKVMIDLETKGLDSSCLKFWWHSHSDMPVFWSGTDTNTINKFKPQDFFVSAVFNKHGDHRTRIDYYHLFRVKFLDVPMSTALPEFGQLDECKAMFDERVKEFGLGFHFDPTDLQLDLEMTMEQDFPDDMTQEELISKVTTGELTWPEAELILMDQEFSDYSEEWSDD